MADKITIIGCGPGGADYLTPIARKHALAQSTLAGARRLFALFPEFNGRKIAYTGTAPLLQSITATPGKIGVLVSGDTSYFSLAESIIQHFGIENCTIIPGISSIQIALARFGLRADTARIISAHAASPELPPESFLNTESIIILGGNPDSTDWLLTLADLTRNTHTLSLGIDLTLPEEQLITLPIPSPEMLTSYLANYSRIILIFHRKT